MPIVKYYTARVCLAQGFTVVYFSENNQLDQRSLWLDTPVWSSDAVWCTVKSRVLTRITN